MNTKEIQKLIREKERVIARTEVQLHEPNTLFGFNALLIRIAKAQLDIAHLESLLQITTTMKKTKVNKLKKAVTAKGKKALKAKKK